MTAKLSRETKDKLVEVLEQCTATATLKGRLQILEHLPAEIRDRISNADQRRVHLDNIVDRCCEFPDGLQFLVNAVKWCDGDTFGVKALGDFFAEVEKQPSNYIRNPTEGGNQHSLAEQLQDTLERKKRLEAAGVSVSDLDNEIIDIKRQLRRGGLVRKGDILGGRYLLVKELGRGGFATVWKALDQNVAADVAVKILHPELAGDIVRRLRFFRGARIMHELDHPSIVKIRKDVAEDDGFYYFVMNYIDGGNLRKAVLKKRVDSSSAFSIVQQIGDAVALAHTKKHLHRDIKPSNILLNKNRKPFLTDFDLATAADTTGGTRTGALGSVLYSAPEMLDRPQEADTRADVYSLAMTAIFILYGQDIPMQAIGNLPSFIEHLHVSNEEIKDTLRRATSWKLDERIGSCRKFLDEFSKARKNIEETIDMSHIFEQEGSDDDLDMIMKDSLEEVEASSFSRQNQGGFFVVIKGIDRGESVHLREGKPLLFGSSPRCDMRLSDKAVSREHLKAELVGDAVVLRDTNSSNGTFVHQTRFKEVTIGFGTEVKLGRTVIKYLPHEEFVDPEPAPNSDFGQLIGADTKMRQLFNLLQDVAVTDATVLIEGETGTGKELIAEEVHNHSKRRNGPFVVFDCSSVPRERIESALFGHVRGAFTGAMTDRRGIFAEASGGTIFFDEIGEMAIALQPSLLRALDIREVRKVGSDSYEKIDVRIIAATNRDLRASVANRAFREDLYYRLAVIRVSVPPLRERGSDIPMLVRHFIEEFSPSNPLEVLAEDMAYLQRYSWPGNVRELRNTIERSCLLSRNGQLNVRDALFEEPTPSLSEPVEDLTRHHSFKSAKTKGDTQLDRRQLRELIRKSGLDKDKGSI